MHSNRKKKTENKLTLFGKLAFEFVFFNRHLSIYNTFNVIHIIYLYRP